MGLVPSIKDGDWVSVRQAIARLGSIKLGPTASPTFAGLTLTGLTASQFVFTDVNKTLVSIASPLVVGYGGSGATTLTDHGLLLGSGADAITPLGAATDGQLPIGSTGVDPVLAALTAGTGIGVANTAGAITISSTITQYTDEMVDDRVASLIQNGTGLSWTYDDNANTLTGNVSITQYTDELVDDRVSSLIQNGTGLAWTYNDIANTLTGNVSITQYTDALARAALSETITGIDYSNTTGVFNLTTGYVIPTATQETNWGTAYTHSQNNTQAHSDYLLNNASDTTTGLLTIEGGVELGKNGVGGSAGFIILHSGGNPGLTNVLSYTDWSTIEAASGLVTCNGSGVFSATALPVSIANGGTGQITAQAATNALTGVAAATNEHVLTKDTATGNAVFKVATEADAFTVKVDAAAVAGYIGATSGTGVIRTNTGLTKTDGGDFVTLAATGLLVDGTAGRVLRGIYLLINNGTNAATIKCEVVNLWNGNTIASTDNISKGSTVGNFSLSADGFELTVEASGLSGSVIFCWGVVSVNNAGTQVNLTVQVLANDINVQVKHVTTGAGYDWTSFVDGGGGYLSTQIYYLTAV